MNIFATNPDPAICAREICEIRLTKMCLETAQIICTVGHINGYSLAPYKATHRHHPCVVWAGASNNNLNWLACLFAEYGREFEARRGKPHASVALIQPHLSAIASVCPVGPMLAHVNCARRESLGLDYTGVADTHEAYRAYLCARWAMDKWAPSWGFRGAPEWNRVDAGTSR